MGLDFGPVACMIAMSLICVNLLQQIFVYVSIRPRLVRLTSQSQSAYDHNSNSFSVVAAQNVRGVRGCFHSIQLLGSPPARDREEGYQ